MEVFKDIIGYEGLYQVSNLGNIKSLKRLNWRGYLIQERMLKNTINAHGYYFVKLSNSGKQKTVAIHKLVAIHFLNHVPCGWELVINHIDFNKANNRLDNLEIVTSRENGNRKHLKSTSKYVGVSWVKKNRNWKAEMNINRKTKHIGCFKNEYDAHLAYQKALSELNNK